MERFARCRCGESLRSFKRRSELPSRGLRKPWRGALSIVTEGREKKTEKALSIVKRDKAFSRYAFFFVPSATLGCFCSTLSLSFAMHVAMSCILCTRDAVIAEMLITLKINASMF